MADPRAANKFEFAVKPEDCHTYVHDDTIVYDATLTGGSAQVGLALTIESSNVVSLVGDGENVRGKLLQVFSDGFCSVHDGGIDTYPGGESATLTPGTKIVGDLGPDSAEGYVRSVNTEHTVSRGQILDASVTTAVIVDLSA